MNEVFLSIMSLNCIIVLECFCFKFVCMLNHFSHLHRFATLRAVAHQAPLPKGFSRQEDWSGLPRRPPGDLPDSGIEPRSLMSPALTDGFFTTSATWEAHIHMYVYTYVCMCVYIHIHIYIYIYASLVVAQW